MISNENSICDGSLLNNKISVSLSLLICLKAGTDLMTIMTCDHKLTFHQFLPTNIFDDAFTNISGSKH